jgi:hypothetical protein
VNEIAIFFWIENENIIDSYHIHTVMLVSKIKKARNLRDSSLRSYMSSLRQMRKMADPAYKGEMLGDCGFLSNYETIFEVLNKLPLTSKKNKLTAALVALKSCGADEELINAYQSELKASSEKYSEFLVKQQKTKAQADNWVNADELRNTLANLEAKTKTFIKRDELSASENDLFQQRVILATYLIFPLRNDFADMRMLTRKELSEVPREEQEENNYLVKSGRKFAFHMNQFKNVGRIGRKILPVNDRELSMLLTAWWRLNTTGWFLTTYNRQNPMSPNGLTKYLQKIFKHTGKQISSSMIRHILISEEMEGEPTIAEQEKRSERFLHSKGIHAVYRKVE